MIAAIQRTMDYTNGNPGHLMAFPSSLDSWPRDVLPAKSSSSSSHRRSSQSYLHSVRSPTRLASSPPIDQSIPPIFPAPALPSSDNATSSSSDYPSSLPLTPPADEEVEDDDNDRQSWDSDASMPMLDIQLTQAQTDGSRSHHTSSPSGPPADRARSDDPQNSSDEEQRTPVPDQPLAPSWLQASINYALSSLPSFSSPGDTLRVVSHTLPYPRASDANVRLPTNNSVLGSIIEAVQCRSHSQHSPYIDITHAVPGAFTVSELPSSPPGTPARFVPSGSYFDSRVFDKAAQVPTYFDFRGGRIPNITPRSVGPPFSIHISIVERYLPPPSSAEYNALFSPKGPSVLIDRLRELSANSGTLLFIYPTRKGAMTFKNQYLGPVLEPLLRRLGVVYGLPANLGPLLGRLEAVESMDDFELMTNKIASICESMSARDDSSRFEIVGALRGSVELDHKLWTEWFIHQERPRLKEVLNTWRQMSGRQHGNWGSDFKEVTSSMILNEIVDGLTTRHDRWGSPIREQIELGVFVIRRTY